MNLCDINEIRELLARRGFRFSKSLGQNFLCAGWVPEQIAEEALLDGNTGVVEVGPGIGCLTVELSRRAKRVVSLELDRALEPVLAETLSACENVEVIFGDVLKTDLSLLAKEKLADCGRLSVCANLPYNITTPVLTDFVESGLFDSITVMIQREVARRICARENTADYGAFTLLMQWYTEPELLFDVAPDCFIPAPKVTSSVIRLRRRSVPPAEVLNQKQFFAVVRAAFNQRRKTLCNALQNGLGVSREVTAAALAALALPETIRGEALSLKQFAALSNALNEEK